MLAFARFLIVGLVICTVLYVVLWFRLRARRRRLILEDWKTSHRDTRFRTFLDEETARYDRLRHRSLIALVYVLPIATVTAIIYLTNFH